MDDSAKGEVGVGVFMHGVLRRTGKHRDNNQAHPVRPPSERTPAHTRARWALTMKYVHCICIVFLQVRNLKCL